MEQILDRSFDEQFDRIQDLVWYPWVGKEYATSPHKILLVGESQYATDENGDHDAPTDKAFREDKETTRYYAGNTMTLKETPAKFYLNLLRTFGVSDELREVFWSKVAYYHFFQNPDVAVSGNVHPAAERMKAWNLWAEVIDVLRPDICLFCGLGLGRNFESWNRKRGREADWEDVASEFYERGQQPIRGRFEVNSTSSTELWFISHPSSRGFSADNWHCFLQRQLPEEMEWLNR